jgi:ATP-dependent DNA ligase
MEMNKIFQLCESMQDEADINKLDKNRFKANTKYDGERVIAVKKGEDILLINRRGNIINNKFSEVVRALKNLDKNFIIDGEIISIDGNFNKLQRRALTKDAGKIKKLEAEIPVKYMIFDILSINDKSIMQETLRTRLNYLKELFLNPTESLELVEYGEINVLLQKAKDKNLEGIVIKDMEGVYENKRSKNWYKHKLFKEITITITGFTDNPAGIRATANDGTALQIAGHHSDEVKAVMKDKGYATIIVQYLEKTKEDKLRFPSFRGICSLQNQGEVLN